MLDSAKTIDASKVFPSSLSLESGSLTSVNPTDEFNWLEFRERDQQLAHRDNILSTNVVKLGSTLAEIWNCKVPRPTLTYITAGTINKQDAPAYISPTGTIVHVKPSDYPEDALDVDQQLYARDLIVHEALVQVGNVLEDPVLTTLGTPVAGGTLTVAWSLGGGTLMSADINPALPLNDQLFKFPDYNLAARDNHLAYWTTQINEVTKNPFGIANRLQVQVLNNGTREADTYVLAEETSTSKIFQADPALTGRLRLVYDKIYKTVRWLDETSTGALHTPQHQPFMQSGSLVNGIQPGQQLKFVVGGPVKKDCEFWRQKAELLNFAPYVESSVFHTSSPSGYLDSSVGLSIPTYDDVAQPTPTLSRFYIPGLTLTSGLYRIAALIEVKPELRLPGGTGGYYNFSSSGGSNTWGFVLPSGSWICRLRYTNTTGTAPNEFTVTASVTGMTDRTFGLRFGSEGWENGDEATTDIPVNSTSTAQNFKITWNPSTSVNTLQILELQFISNNLADLNTLTLTAKLRSSSAQFGETAQIVILPYRHVPSVVWFNVDIATSLANPYVDVEWVGPSSDQVVFHVQSLQLQQLVESEPVENSVGFQATKTEFLHRALRSVVDAYDQFIRLNSDVEFREQLDDEWVWTPTSMDAFINAITSFEPRFALAFRESRPGDLGRMCILPNGLEPVFKEDTLSAGIIRAHYDAINGRPILCPLQPWMIDIKARVADDAFSDNEYLSTNTP